MGYGKKAAREIDERLMGAKRIRQLFREYEYELTPPAQPSEKPRQAPPQTPATERVHTFEEVTGDLTGAQVMVEACRCLRCDIRATEH